MRAGLLRHKLTIEQGTDATATSDNSYGGPSLTWSNLATDVWAEKVDLSGTELFQAQQVNAEVSTRFRIRHRDDLTAKMRVLYDGDYYGVLAWLDPDGRGESLELLCRRDLNVG